MMFKKEMRNQVASLKKENEVLSQRLSRSNEILSRALGNLGLCDLGFKCQGETIRGVELVVECSHCHSRIKRENLKTNWLYYYQVGGSRPQCPVCASLHFEQAKCGDKP